MTGVRPLDRAAVAGPDLPIRILQFGTGNFLRAFTDQMVQRANDAGATASGISLVRTTTGPSRVADELRRQDGVYHVLLEGVRDGRLVREFTLVTAVQEVLSPEEDFAAYRTRCLSPDLRIIVSNTTEAGIVWLDDEDLSARPARSFPGRVAALLHDRFEHFAGAESAGLHVICCELIEDNAATLRALVLRHAARAGWDERFARWVRSACHFHDSLVDRIVPGYPEGEADDIRRELGFADGCLVKGEYYGLWAIGGDASVRELLPLDRAGLPVTFVEDIAPLRVRKVRVLNGLHTALAAVGLARGLRTVFEAAADPVVAPYLDLLLVREILPSLPGSPAENSAFAAATLERFANPALEHRLADIALNALSKWQARALPVVLDSWTAGRDAPCTTFGLAAILALYAGRAGVSFEPRDDARLVALVRDAFASDEAHVAVRRIVTGAGFLPPDDPRATRLAEEVAAQGEAIERLGVAGALAALGGPAAPAAASS